VPSTSKKSSWLRAEISTIVRGGFLYLVHERSQSRHIGDEDGQPDAVLESGAFGVCNHFHVHESLANPSLIAVNQPVIRGIDATHAGDKYEVASARA